MRIAVLGFGSLVNQPHSPIYNKRLDVEKPQGVSCEGYNISAGSAFVPAGNLKLPIRLGRVSGQGTVDRRVTLVLDKNASNETVFYAQSQFDNLNDAIRNLREREGISSNSYQNVGYVNLRSQTSRSRIDTVAEKIKEWAVEKGFDAVIWTDLPGKGIEFGPHSTGRDILPLLENDRVLLKNTQGYLNNLPYQTPLQKRILALPIEDNASAEYKASLTADFTKRDAIPQTDVNPADWFKSRYGDWGPMPKTFPKPIVPQEYNPFEWKRDRIIEAAKHFTGLPYKRADGKRGHFPARGCGLDCSNFAAWVYNYALGIRFTSSVDQLASRNYHEAGRFLAPREQLKKGDLVLLNGNPKHVVIYVDEHHVIDSTSARPEGVGIRDVRLACNRWCRPDSSNPNYIGARRIIE